MFFMSVTDIETLDMILELFDKMDEEVDNQ
jgi:hypothetical protein